MPAEIKKIWKEYRLEERTHFNTPVTSVRRVAGGNGGEEWRERSKWVVNDGSDGEFDAVIVNIGTCGAPNMVQFPGMPGYKAKEEEHDDKQGHDKQEHDKHGKVEKRKKNEKGEQHDEEKDKPHQDNGAHHTTHAPKTSAWNSPAETKNAVKLKRNQRAKREQGFPKLYEAYSDASSHHHQDSPSQDHDAALKDEAVALPDKVGDVHGATTTTAGGEGAWDAVEEPTWKLGQDQVEKKEQGFPRPEEAYELGPDVQKDTKRPEDIHKTSHPAHQHQDDKDTNSQDIKGSEARGDGEVFEKPILHSSQLTSSGMDFRGKTVVVLGGGASAVEAVETALAEGAKHVVMVVRDDKVRLGSSCTMARALLTGYLLVVDHPAQRRHRHAHLSSAVRYGDASEVHPHPLPAAPFD